MSNVMLKQTQRYREINSLFLTLTISIFLSRIDVIQGNNAIECGTVNLYRELMLGGNEVLRDEWPFIAALYYSKSLKYFCGGTIISNKHVLTAAHCIHGKFSNVVLSPDQITVRIGAYNLTASNEPGAVDRNVTQIVMHPDWNVFEEKYDADIAILVLNENVTFSSNIRPVCMPVDDINIDGVKGTVVGWGITESAIAEGIPRQTETVALNDSYCYRADSGIARYSSERSFCGTGDNGTPNKGDSGDGYFVVIGSSWVQYGTVSVVRTNATGHVVIGSFAIYTKLTSLKPWIADTVRQTGSAVSEATIKINLHCSYGYDDDGIYGCWLYDLNIRKPNFVVNSVTGSHKLQKEHKDVELIAFESGLMFYLPDNVGNVFKNLKYLTVGNPRSVSIDTKRIFRSNFQNLEHLEDIRFLNNAIEELDEDSLWDLPNLQSFQIEKNKLKLLHAATFNRNFKLTTVYVLSNVLKGLPRNLFENNPLLDIVVFDGNFIETLEDGFFDTNINLKTVSFKRNRLEHLGSNLFQNNLLLESVDFSNNAIKTIDEQIFRSNPKLKILSLGPNNLEFIPAQLLQNKTLLRGINFGKNSLKSVDERLFETNIWVSEIYLWSNQLTVLPRNLFHKKLLLDVVDLSKNFIYTTDEKLFETNFLLGKVSLASNRLEELPQCLFEHNPYLEFLNVRNNFLATLNEHIFESNPRLSEVYFEGNYLSFIPPEVFKNNRFLTIVDLGNNTLEAIDERLFHMNAKLRQVYLSSNLLVSLPINLFRNNSLLEVVDLSKNFFKTIDENIFRSNVRLAKISFERNRLQSLPRNLFEGNKHLQHVDFRDNSLKVIEIDFTQFNEAFFISLYKNVCIDAVFYNVDGTAADSETFRNRFTNLTEFQDMVKANCSDSINPTSLYTVSVE